MTPCLNDVLRWATSVYSAREDMKESSRTFLEPQAF